MNATAAPTAEALAALADRTTALLNYAGVLLDEIRARGQFGGDAFDRAHQESFLLLLFAAHAAFVQELNVYYGVNLDRDGVSAGSIRNAVNAQGRTCAETAALHQLGNNQNSWFSQAKRLRDFGAHIAGVPRVFYQGGPNHGEVHLKDPLTDQPIPRHFPDLFGDWLNDMRTLLTGLRATARATNKL